MARNLINFYRSRVHVESEEVALLLKVARTGAMEDTRFRSIPAFLRWLENTEELRNEDVERIHKLLSELNCPTRYSKKREELVDALLDCYTSIIKQVTQKLKAVPCIADKLFRRLGIFDSEVYCYEGNENLAAFFHRHTFRGKMYSVARRDDDRLRVALMIADYDPTVADIAYALEKAGGGLCYWYREQLEYVNYDDAYPREKNVAVIECFNNTLKPNIAALLAGIFITNVGKEGVEAELVQKELNRLLNKLREQAD